MGKPTVSNSATINKRGKRIAQADSFTAVDKRAVAFEEAARELGCDESDERFDAALRRIGQYKPPPGEKPVRPKKAEST